MSIHLAQIKWGNFFTEKLNIIKLFEGNIK